MSWTIECADVLDWAAEYDGPKFHACLCDPPYELAFMGKSWDNSGVAFQPATWAAIAEHLHPGGFIMAFGGSRTYHRLAVAAEDAGLIIHPGIVHLQGQGFPKATRILKKEWKETEKANPNHRPVSGVNYDGIYRGGNTGASTIPAPATPLAQTWQGHRYGLQALKPCAEFILVAQKPYAGKPVESIVSTGAGALNIDQARVATGDGEDFHRPVNHTNLHEGWDRPWRSNPEALETERIRRNESEAKAQQLGRWPPNVCLTHSGGCVRVGTRRVKNRGTLPDGVGVQGDGDSKGIFSLGSKVQSTYADPDGKETVEEYRCVEGCAVRELGAQSGERRNGGQNETSKLPNRGMFVDGRTVTQYAGDTGTAARFYPQHDWQYEIAERLAGVTPFRYVAKAASRERSQGLEDFYWRKDKDEPSGFVRISQGEWKSLDEKQRAQGNIHPTQKPIELCKFLATLLLPPPEYAPRRIAIPFFGKGSEAVGALLAGFDEIVGIEMEPNYCSAGEARLRFWSGWAERGYDDPKAILKEAKKEEKKHEKAQMELTF